MWKKRGRRFNWEGKDEAEEKEGGKGEKDRKKDKV